MTRPAQTAAGARPVAGGRDEIVARLLDLFRRDGFEGVSIADISKATGLGKSSLYHHFPGGKDEMARAVVDQVRGWADENILAPLRAPGPRAGRIGRMLDNVVGLYAGGLNPCVIASMLVGAREDAIFAALQRIVGAWLAALAAALVDTGATPDAAEAAALDALTRIQGALVMSRLMRDGAPFTAAIHAVRRELLAI
jgi:AcrR family transcriptional regulator